MKKDFQVDGKGVLYFLKSRKVVLENKDNLTIIDLQLLWFLIAMVFLSGFIIVGLIVALLLGCKISIVDSSKQYIGKDR